MPGYVSEADKRALFERALVFVLPSHTEGFGIPAVEAMTVGVPVIAANRGALGGTVGEAGLLLATDDSGELHAALETVLADPGRRDRMREAGWAQAAQFTWARTAAGVRDAWHAALEHRRGRRG
jgi:glycosyltransferase involved in cell wall biosynthesis